jgi:hypothetical protein
MYINDEMMIHQLVEEEEDTFDADVQENLSIFTFL